MRIHYVTPGYLPAVGGVETHVRSLARLAVDRGHDVTVHTGGRRDERSEDSGVAVVRYRPRVSLGYYAAWFTPEVHASEVLHLHGYGFLPNDLAARRAPRSRLFHTLHHGIAQPRPGLTGPLRWSMYEALWGHRTLRRCARVFPSSPADVPALRDLGIPPGRIEVMPTGLPDEAFENRKGEPPAQLPRDPFFLFVGRLSKDKCVDHLLSALMKLGPSASLVIAGPDAGDERRLRAVAARLGVAGRAIFAGFVPEETKRWLFDNCVAYVLPSRYEAQGIGILEAWARGRPVVASAVGGVKYLVRHGVDGLLYPHGDMDALVSSLRQLAENASMRASLGSEGRRRAWSEYRLQVLGSRMMHLYETGT